MASSSAAQPNAEPPEPARPGSTPLIPGAVDPALLEDTAATAQAAPAHPTAPTTVAVAPTATARNFPCGYDGYDGSNGNQSLYNHSGTGDVVIQVDHFFWQTTYDCVAPGSTRSTRATANGASSAPSTTATPAPSPAPS